jgi:hypothetical protein
MHPYCYSNKNFDNGEQHVEVVRIIFIFRNLV